jgi:phage-related protein
LTANPIGLVIVGLAALGAALVIAYKKSETFRAIVDGAFSAVKGAFSALSGRVSSFVSEWSAKFAAAVAVVRAIPGTIAGIFAGLGSTLYNAGVAIIGQFAAGITAKMGDAIQAVQDGLGKIAGMLPGSPIKWGPLKSWNNGGAGFKLMAMLADGIERGTPKVRRATGELVKALKDQFAGLVSEAKSMGDSIANAFTKDVFGGTMEEFFGGLNQGVWGLQSARASLDILKAIPGISAGFLSSLFASGNTGLISSLAADPNAALTGSALFEQRQALAEELGQAVAGNVYNPQLDVIAKEIATLRADLPYWSQWSAREFANAINSSARDADRGSRGNRRWAASWA